MTLDRRIQIGFAIAIVIILAVGAAALRSTAAPVGTARGVVESPELRGGLEATFAELIYAETAVRGYVITGDTTYLPPYDSAQARLGGLLGGLRALTSDNPAQLERLDSLLTLVSVRLERFHWTVETRRTGGPAAAARAVIGGRGKELMHLVRGLIGQMEGEEARLLAQRSAVLQTKARLARLAAWSGALVAVTLAVIAGALVSRELAGRLRAERTLGETQTRFRQVLASSTAVIYANTISGASFQPRSVSGNITYFNPGAERIFGYRAAEVNGKPLTVLMPERFRDAHHAGIARYLATGEARVVGKTVELAGQKKDGAEFPLELSLASWQRGSEIAFTAIIRDVTERKRVDETLRRHTAQVEAANAELDAFAYSVSHDLRAPLRGIDGFSQALLEDYADRLDDAGKDYLTRVRSASQRMATLIDDLLNLSRVTRSKMHVGPLDLSALATGIAEGLQKRDPARRVEVAIAPGLHVSADPGLMRVVLQNLLENAWKFTGKLPDARIEVGSVPHDGGRAYFVRDNGAGFDMTYVHKLLGAFQRLHGTQEFDGTGIGLATVQRVIHRHGGRVWAEGAVGDGATFYFTL